MRTTQRIAATVLMVASMCATAQEHEHGNAGTFGEVHVAASCNEGARPDFDRGERSSDAERPLRRKRG